MIKRKQLSLDATYTWRETSEATGQNSDQNNDSDISPNNS